MAAEETTVVEGEFPVLDTPENRQAIARVRDNLVELRGKREDLQAEIQSELQHGATVVSKNALKTALKLADLDPGKRAQFHRELAFCLDVFGVQVQEEMQF